MTSDPEKVRPSDCLPPTQQVISCHSCLQSIAACLAMQSEPRGLRAYVSANTLLQASIPAGFFGSPVRALQGQR